MFITYNLQFLPISAFFDWGIESENWLGTMRLFITEVTEMSAGNYCVAGWDGQNQRMVRPLPGGKNWTSGLLHQFGTVPGATVDFVLLNTTYHSAFPHRMEDTPIDAGKIVNLNAAPINWFSPGAPPASSTVSAAFGGSVAFNSQWNGVFQGAYVPLGAQVNSLSAIVVPRASLTFKEEVDSFTGARKLKGMVSDANGVYKLAVSSAALKNAWRTGGLPSLQNNLPAGPSFHIRLGLARAFDNPPTKCYMMINGVH